MVEDPFFCPVSVLRKNNPQHSFFQFFFLHLTLITPITSDLSLTLGMCPTGGGGGDRIPPDDSSKPGPAPGSLDCGLQQNGNIINHLQEAVHLLC